VFASYFPDRLHLRLSKAQPQGILGEKKLRAAAELACQLQTIHFTQSYFRRSYFRQSYLPVPVRLAVCGLFRALSLTLNVPVSVPTTVGVNTTLMVQLLAAFTLVPQVVVDTLKSPVVEIVTPVSATFCWFLSVNTFAELVDPTLVAEYVAVAGVNAAGTTPVPVSAAVCGLFEALSETESVPVSVPTTVGVNTTLMVQLLEAFTLVPQVVAETLKSPVVEIVTPVSATLCWFLSVNTFAALDVPSAVDEYVALAGANVAGTVPVPDSVDVCGLFEALSETESVPVSAPITVGVNTTLMVQLLEAFTLVPQVVVETLKSPVVEIVTPVSATFCWLLSVNTFAALEVPTAVVGNV
jgi:hypothetical protein